VTRSWTFALGFSVLGLVTVGAPVRSAIAADDPTAQCIASSDKGLELRKQGKLIEARPVLAACAAPACGADISGVCQKRLADINSVMPSIVFLPKDGSGNDVAGVKMTIDGASTSETLDGRPVALDPGAHTFKFEAAGQPPVERSFVLVEGAKDRQERVDMAPVPSTAGPAGSTTATLGGTATEHPGGTQKTVGFVVGGAGVLGIAAGSVFGLLASSKWSASKSDCGSPANCPNHAQAVSEHDTAASDATVSTVAFVVGGAALATSVLLLVMAPKESPAPATTGSRLQVSPGVGPGGVSLSVLGAF
jgi:hypothetical protein